MGVIARLSLDRDFFKERDISHASRCFSCLEPFDIAISHGVIAYSAGSSIFMESPTLPIRELKHPWMSFVHTLEFSNNGESLLVAAAGYDCLFEFSVATGMLEWDWCAWDHGFNKVAVNSGYIARSVEVAESLKQVYGSDFVICCDNPEVWPDEGVPTPQSVMRINCASYGHAEQLLVTGYHRPEVFFISRDGSVKCVDLDLKHPHSFMKLPASASGVYRVVDSGRGKLLDLGPDAHLAGTWNFASLDADVKKRAGFGEWVQTAAAGDDTGNLVIAVDTLRDGIHIIDLASKRRRFIGFPENWSVQKFVVDPP